MSLELRVIERTSGNVIINYDELKEKLALELKKYQGLVFDDEQITEAKKTRASLNKVVTAIDNRRKEEKAIFLKGFEVFEEQTKELTNMIKAVSLEIDNQIKDFEEKEKEKKKIKIANLWTSLRYQKITLDKIWNDKWLNKTFTDKQIEEEMQEKIKQIEEDLESFDFLCGDDKEKVKTLKIKYLVHLDKAKIINDYKQEQQARELLADQNVNEEMVVVDGAKEGIRDSEKEIFEISFKVYGTKEELTTLSNFLRRNNYIYERI